jgi:hypothetical protein
VVRPRVSLHFSFSGGRPKFSKLLKEQTNRQTANKMRLLCDNSIIALPNARHFDGNLQLRWLTQSKNGDCHATLKQFQRGVMIAIFCFCCRGRLVLKKTCICIVFLYFSLLEHPLLDALPSSRTVSPPLIRKGWQIMASQGNSQAPPLQGGMGDASLAPQGTVPAPCSWIKTRSMHGKINGCLPELPILC